MVAASARPPLAIAFALISLFAIFHGHSHGAALPDFGVPLLYAAGFVIATGLLHVCGIALGLLFRWPAGRAAASLDRVDQADRPRRRSSCAPHLQEE